jgi:phage shock protein C
MTERLYRSYDERMIAGIAGGMADRWDLDPALVRIAWVVLGLFTAGFAIVLYILMAIVVPMDPVESPRPASAADGETVVRQRAEREARIAERRARRSGPGSTGVLLGALLIVVGAYFLVAQFMPWFDFGRLWPILVIGLGVVLLLSAMSHSSKTETTTREQSEKPADHPG